MKKLTGLLKKKVKVKERNKRGKLVSPREHKEAAAPPPQLVVQEQQEPQQQQPDAAQKMEAYFVTEEVVPPPKKKKKRKKKRRSAAASPRKKKDAPEAQEVEEAHEVEEDEEEEEEEEDARGASAAATLKSPLQARFQAKPRDSPLSDVLSRGSKARRRMLNRRPQVESESFYSSSVFRSAEAQTRDETEELRVYDTVGAAYKTPYESVATGETLESSLLLSGIAWEAETQVRPLEFVLVGVLGHGKTSVLEGILGHAFGFVAFEGASRRPIFVRCRLNRACKTPRFTLLRDDALGVSRRVVYSDAHECAAEMQRRLLKVEAGVVLTEPVELVYESDATLDMTFIDTPGLRPSKSPAADACRSLVLQLARPSHRHLLFVEEAIDARYLSADVAEMVQLLDPSFVRSTMVYTKMNTFLQSVSNAYELNTFVQGIRRSRPHATLFWTTQMSSTARSKVLRQGKEEYRQRVWQLLQRDRKALDALQFDRTMEPYLGVGALRCHVLSLTLEHMRRQQPRIAAAARATMARVKRALESADEKQLRNEALQQRVPSLYVQALQRAVEGKLQGSLEHASPKGGQLSAEEAALPLAKSDLDVATQALDGGQQIQRVLQELQGSLVVLDIGDQREVQDFVYVAEKSRAENLTQKHFAAELLSIIFESQLRPLLEPLAQRLAGILKRFFTLFDRSYAMSSTSGDNTPLEQLILQCSTGFRNGVREAYFAFVDELAGRLVASLQDEFYATETYLWQLQTDERFLAPTSALMRLTREAWDVQRERFVRNMRFRIYQHMVLPLVEELPTVLQDVAHVSGSFDAVFQVQRVGEILSQRKLALTRAQHELVDATDRLREVHL